MMDPPITIAVKAMEAYLQELVGMLCKASGDSNCQIYSIGAGWGYVVDGDFSDPVSFDELGSLVQSYYDDHS